MKSAYRLMQMVNRFLFDYGVATAAKLSGLTMIACIVLQIGSRMVLKIPFPWTDELARGMFIWFCFLGAALAMRQYAHLGIDYFRSKLGDRGQWISDIVVCLAVIAFGVLVAYYGRQLINMPAIGRQKTPIIRIPMLSFYLSVPVSGLLLAFQGLEFLLQYFVTGKPRPPIEEPVLPSTEEMAKMF